MKKQIKSDTVWHLDKRVPLALIFTIVTQTAGLIWWASNLQYRVATLEEKTSAMSSQGDRLIRLEENVRGIREDMGDVKTSIKQLLQRN